MFNLIGGWKSPSEKYELGIVGIIPTELKNKIHVPNHQPVTI